MNSNTSTEETIYFSIVGEHEDNLKIALEVLLSALLAFIMMAMGCDTTWSTLWAYLRRPVGVLIGMASQFCVLPLCAFGIARCIKLTPYESLSLLILSCCPGGVVSNLFTMWCNGNVSLSICMTTVSTVMALGLMPLNILIYTQSWDGEDVSVPYNKLTITLVTILIPVLLGITVKSKWPKAAPWVIRCGTTAGFLAIIGSIIIQALLIPGLFDCGWKSYTASLLLPFFGFNFGFIWARFFKLNYVDARTIAIETSSQNVPLALTITLLSFPFGRQREMAPIPMLFAIFIHIEAITACLLYYWWRKTHHEECLKTGNNYIEKNILQKSNAVKFSKVEKKDIILMIDAEAMNDM